MAIFLSMASEDQARVNGLRDFILAAFHTSVEIDTYLSNPLGPDRQKEENRRLVFSEAVMLAISRHWLASKKCAREYDRAGFLEKPIIPVLIEPDLHEIADPESRELLDLIKAQTLYYDLSSVELLNFEAKPGTEYRRLGIGGQSLALLEQLQPFARGHTVRVPMRDRRAAFYERRKDERHLEPFKGLEPYVEADWMFFFGREEEQRIATQQIVSSALSGRNNLFVLSGPSGAGKSSFMRAGVLRELTQYVRRVEVLTTIDGHVPDPLAAFGEALNKMRRASGLKDKVYQAKSASDVRAMLTQSFIELYGVASQGKKGSVSDNILTRSIIFILPIDQGEALLPVESNQSRVELRLLLEQLRPYGLIIVATVRDGDFINLQNSMFPAFTMEVLPVKPITEKAVLEAVVKSPGEMLPSEIKFDGDVWKSLYDEFSGSDSVVGLPLLALTVQRLYREAVRTGTEFISRSVLNKVGGIFAALDASLNEIRETLSVENADLFELVEIGPLKELRFRRNVLLGDYVIYVIAMFLVDLDLDTNEITPVQLTKSAYEKDAPLKAIIDAFDKQRLVTQGGKEHEAYFILAHEAVIKHLSATSAQMKDWNRLLTAFADLKQQANAWRDAEPAMKDSFAFIAEYKNPLLSRLFDTQKGELLKGEPLNGFLNAVRTKADDIRDSEAAAKRAKRRLLALVVMLTSCVVGLTVALGWFSISIQSQKAVTEAAAAFEVAHWNDARAILERKVEGFEKFRSPWAVKAQRQRLKTALEGYKVTTHYLDRRLDLPDRAAVKLTSQALAIATGDPSIILWNWRVGKDAFTTAQTRSFPSNFIVGNDGEWLVYPDIGKDVVLKRRTPISLSALGDQPTTFAINRTGTIIAAGGRDNRAAAWQVEADGVTRALIAFDKTPSLPTEPSVLAISGDDRWLAIGRKKSWARANISSTSLMDLTTTNSRPLILQGPVATVTALAFDAASENLYAFFDTGDACRWDMSQIKRGRGAECRQIARHSAPVFALEMARDARTAFSGDSEGLITRFALPLGASTGTWTLRNDGVRKLALLEDQTRLAVLGVSGRVYIIDPRSKNAEPQLIFAQGFAIDIVSDGRFGFAIAHDGASPGIRGVTTVTFKASPQ